MTTKGKAYDGEKYGKIRKQGMRDIAVAATVCVIIVVLLFILPSWKSISHPSPDVEKANRVSNLKSRVEKTVARITKNEKELAAQVAQLDAQVREIKSKVDIMETSEEGMAVAKKLQDATRELLKARYGGVEPYRVKIVLEFQDTIPDFAENGPNGTITIEMAPSKLVPHSVFSFLEIARTWKGGSFHRQAPHVLQVAVSKPSVKHLAFQEYSPEFPHVQGTVGYAGRPSGPAWYISIKDNSKNHGPGSQQQHNPYEADSCFGRVVGGFEDVVPRIRKMPAKDGFIADSKKHVLIRQMHILVKDPNGKFVEWKPHDIQ
eukprot:CAMPEP_0118718944 /NCGR_PEP_ID=MMETSP0800-20121206/29126_1 /TAXON_ID=210618 ORGANISM="Striatella unipunctata, Strain CCMP2910" /NCGR_SAMPLE_ID=MMETSP0800 /ASSEMBLY_ACC=CAM_ASM_000638 /LENGTH=317 /DNA_ID=CAMNT_0006626109 /DNA_START=22 /DNA_END=975 /DNA_ORIENTATION=+